MASNSKPSSGDNKAVKVAGVEQVAIPDWRSQLKPETRQRIMTDIKNTMKRHLSEDLNLEQIAIRFEEKIYGTATSQPDYLKKISNKMLSMESKTQGPQTNPASNPNLQNLQNPNPGSGAIQMNSTNQSTPPVTQPPPVSMTSLSQAPGGNISLAQQQQNGLNLLRQQQQQQQMQMQQNGVNLLQQQYLLRQQQHLIQMRLNQIQQHQIMNNNNNNNYMTSNNMINVNAVQQQQMLMWQNQMINMNNTNNNMMNVNNTNNNVMNMMMRAGGNNMNNVQHPQMSCRPPIQQGLNYMTNNMNNNNMIQWQQQQQRSVGMLQAKNNAASMDSIAQKGKPPGQLEVVCQKQQMVSKSNEGLKERLIKKNEEEVREWGSWVNPAAKILVLLVIMLVLIHTVHELGFDVFGMFE